MTAYLAALLLLQGGAPASDPRLGSASRSQKEGWIMVHLAGKPGDIGYQYGFLLAPEIADAQAALKLSMKEETGKDWSFFRNAARTLFWDKLDPEYQEEIEGQAEGLASKGVSADKWDVLAYNAHIEISGYYLPWLQNQPSQKESCSAFVATGDATKDGRVVMGHNLWWDLLMGQRFDVIVDITPERGNRFVMDALPGLIHSASDFAINSAGILVTETTISGLMGFDPNGLPEFMRMRKATQYANSLDEWADIMRKGNNGGYANTWLLADTKTEEIGRLELGLKNVIWEKKKNGWFVGSNFPDSPKLIAEEVPGGWSKDPRRNGCEARRLRWNTLLNANRGQIDAEKAKAFLADTVDAVTGAKGATGRTLCGRNDGLGILHGATNTKVTTSELASHLSFWARMGYSDGSTFDAASFLAKYPTYAPFTGYLHDIPAREYILYPGQ